MQEILKRLLVSLEKIGEHHEELFDSEVRERIGNAIMDGFIRRRPDSEVDNDFGLFSPEANEAVRSAIVAFLSEANRVCEGIEFNSFHDRLNAVQDAGVRTNAGNDYDEFFGHTPPEFYDENGNVIRKY